MPQSDKAEAMFQKEGRSDKESGQACIIAYLVFAMFVLEV